MTLNVLSKELQVVAAKHGYVVTKQYNLVRLNSVTVYVRLDKTHAGLVEK